MSSNVYGCWEKFRREYLQHILRLGELIIAFAIGTSTLVAFGTQYWVETEEYREGLWVKCPSGADEECVYLPVTGLDSYLMACRVFMSFSLICGLFASVVAIVSMIYQRGKLQLAGGILFGCQGLWLLLGLGSFGAGYSVSARPSWSYSIGWLAFALSVVACIYFVVSGILRIKGIGQMSDEMTEEVDYRPLRQRDTSTNSSDSDDDED